MEEDNINKNKWKRMKVPPTLWINLPKEDLMSMEVKKENSKVFYSDVDCKAIWHLSA